MARVVFSLTTAQVKALLEHKDRGYRADYGATSGLVAKGWLKEKRTKGASSWSYWNTRYELTPKGRAVLAVIRALKLDKIPEKDPASAPGAP